jgi:hypothetical protein
MESLSKVNNYLNTHLAVLHQNKYVRSVLILVLVVYAVYAKPALPSYLSSLLHNVVVKAVMITLGLYYFNDDLLVSAGVSVAFLGVMYLVNRENMGNTCPEGQNPDGYGNCV